jgi:hypothetical protein
MHQHIASEKAKVTSAQKENMKSHASICVACAYDAAGEEATELMALFPFAI